MKKTFNGKPLFDVVVVKRTEPETKIGSFFLAESALEHQDQGEVIAVGEGKLLDNGNILPLRVKPGDKILYSKYANLEFKHGGEKYVTMREADIILILGD